MATHSYTTMERAATKTMRTLAKEVELAGRAEIAGGIGVRNARGFFARAKPRVGYSLNASMRGYLRIGYLNIFERGSTVRPKSGKLFWVPLSDKKAAGQFATVPTKIGRKKLTPKLYTQLIGPLQYVKRPGKPPLLVGRVTGKATGKLTVARLKSGARNARRAQANSAFGGRASAFRTTSVPIFVGISAAKMPDRLNVDRVYREAAARIPEIYAQIMAAEQRR